MLDFFNFEKKIFKNFACVDLGKNFVQERQFFFWKNHTFFGDTPSVKKGWGIHFLKEFFYVEKKIDERLNEGTS